MDKLLIEWISLLYYPEQEAFCPWCGNLQSDGHREDCSRSIVAFNFIAAEREVERLQGELKKAESDIDTWRWEFGKTLKRAEALDETASIMKNNYDKNIEELRAEIKEWMQRAETAESEVERLAYLDTIRQYAGERDRFAAEVEPLRAALRVYANDQNWGITGPKTIEWLGDEEFPWHIAEHVLAGEE